jgi:hypothetical protein
MSSLIYCNKSTNNCCKNGIGKYNYCFYVVSPDRSGKPTARMCNFFLAEKSDQRKLLFLVRKIDILARTCSVVLEKAP